MKHKQAAITRWNRSDFVPPALALAGLLASSECRPAGQLPVPCAAGTCGTTTGSPQTWLDPASAAGSASYVRQPNRFDITQNASSVALNWQSFNISAGNTVNFVQPSSSSVALNRIFQGDAVQIFGALNANGKVYLLNQNGFLFGAGSSVNVGGLVASSLTVPSVAQALQSGIVSPPGLVSDPANFVGYVDSTGHALPSGGISVQAGASISSNQGQVLLFAPSVQNSGLIQAPNGQVMLAAGQRVYLQTSGDPNLRGLLVEVGDDPGAAGGTVTNGSLGQIMANEGNVTLAGLAVNQYGRVSATTTVRTNGSIVLQARDTTLHPANTQWNLLPTRAGQLVLGPSSVTEVTLEGGAGDTTVDVNAQPKSSIALEGETIDVLDQASILAPSGNVTLSAVTINSSGLALGDVGVKTDQARVWLAPTSTIDVSGAVVSEPMSDNSLAVQLRGSELADSPQQRNGVLHGDTVYIDLRQHGTLPDGTPWIGTPIANLSADVGTVQRDVFERNLTGGTVTLNSSGSVIESPGATINVAGGQIDWQAGYVKSSVLLGADGRTYPIASANPQMTYVGVLDSVTQADPHWGTTSTITLPGQDPRGIYQAAYTEGKDAGTIAVDAPAMVFDGTLNGSVTTGLLQRQPTTTNTAPFGLLYRSPDEVPLGGTLILGHVPDPLDSNPQRQVLQALTFAEGDVLPTLSDVSGKPFSPESDPLPMQFTTSLRPELFSPGAMSNLQIYAEGTVTVPAGVDLAPGDGASLTVSAGSIDVGGHLVSAGGSVTLNAIPTVAFPGMAPVFGATGTAPPALTLESGAAIDVSGTWVNDSQGLTNAGLLPLSISGGNVKVTSAGALDTASGSSIDASGGAQRTAGGTLVAGKGGSISLSAASVDASIIDKPLAVSLRAEALNNDGTLTLTLPALCLSVSACGDDTQSRIDPDLLNSSFSQVNLIAANGGLTVASDVEVAARQQNLQWLAGAFLKPSAPNLQALTQSVTLPAYLRQPESLTLKATAPLQLLPLSTAYPQLEIERGASITLDPGATLALSTNSRVIQDGSLKVPAGVVDVTVSGNLIDPTTPGFLADQAIWFGPQSLIDVRGTAVLTPNDRNLELGTVLPGGTIQVSDQSGFIITDPTSALVADGATANLDVSSPSSGVYQRQSVGSAGGSILLSASEGMQLNGELSARAGPGSTAPGGTLSIKLDSGAVRSVSYVPNSPRNVLVSASTAPVIVGEDTAVPTFLDGEARIAAATINEGGFDKVSLSSRSFSAVTNAGTVLGSNVGQVTFDSGVTLAPAISLTVDAPEIRTVAAAGANVSLNSDYIALGSTDVLSQAVNTAPTLGATTLQVSARLVDLVGAFDVSGFKSTSISSSGDIRAIGVQLAGQSPQQNSGYQGLLDVPGSLTLSAQQIYPTTLTSYAINVLPGAAPNIGSAAAQNLTSTLTIDGQSGTPGAVLSAAGSLALSATEIDDSGVLRAPVGAVSLVGQNVRLLPGATISVSTDGLTIPFGETQGGFDWVYEVCTSNVCGSNAYTRVYGIGAGDVLPPQKQVNLTASNLTLSSGAKIDLSGGGNLQAYEWIEGLGGTRDVLSPAVSPNTFAVIPGLKLPYAPIDPHEDIGFSQPTGASVYLSGGDGLPTGTYALLPARYALLPGAYLVKAVSGYTDLAPGQTLPQLDGSVIVSGYRTYGGSGRGDTLTSGFDVAPGSYALQEAQYNLTSANSFFSAQAAAAMVNTPRLPADAGTLAINASSTATLAASLITSASPGARGAEVDLSSSNVIVTSAPETAAAGYVAVDPAQLDALGAESILIGGTRTETAAGTDVNVTASNVVVDQGTQLSTRELVLVSNGSIDLKSDASITATGAPVEAEPALVMPTGTAALRVSTGPLTDLTYSGTGPGGQLTVASGATLSAPGSISLDAGGTVNFAGSLSASGAAIRLGGTQISLGNVPQGTSGFNITDSLFTSIANSNLLLSASNPIAVYGPVDLTLSKLGINAPGITDATADAALSVSATQINLTSASTAPFVAAAAPAVGSVQLSATHVVLGGGTFSVAGTADTVISASADMTASGDGTLGTSGNLHLESGVMQTAAGVTFGFIGGGDVATAQRGAPATTTAAAGPGGALSFSGQTVTLANSIVLPGGQLTASASGPQGNVSIADGAALSVAGFAETFDNEVQSAPGGTIQLTSASGSITVAPTAVLDISSGTGSSNGGSLTFTAPTGAVSLAGIVHASGGSGQSGGNLSIDADSFSFSSLIAQAGTAGLTGTWNLRERCVAGCSEPDFVLGAGTTLQASAVSLTTDQGGIQILGNIDTSSSLGGTITLAADNDIEVAGSLLAGSTTRADRGGTIELFSENGGILLDPSSQLSVGGAGGTATGTVWLRAQQGIVMTDLSADPSTYRVRLDGAINGAKNIYLEGYQVYQRAIIGAGDVLADPSNPLFADAATFVTEAAPVAANLGLSNIPAFSVIPGIEIDAGTAQAPADLHLSTTWDLSSWRFGPNMVPGVLTLRATGSLYVDANQMLTDGVEQDFVSGLFFPMPGASWSYRVAAGADLGSANPLAVRSVTELPSLGIGGGNLVLQPGTPADELGGVPSMPTAIRTGTGSIDIRVAGDLVLGNQASVIYTAGAPGPGIPIDEQASIAQSRFVDLPYPVGGGNVTISAGLDVIGAPSSQLFTDWLWRTGLPNITDDPDWKLVPSWTPSIGYFEQGVGALGGGDLIVSAGRNIVDLGANVPSVGQPLGDGTFAGTTTQEANNGILRVTAGEDIAGGKYLDMAGQALLSAGGKVTVGVQQALHPVLAVGSGQFSVTARGGVTIETVLDPTLLPQSFANLPTVQPGSGFTTYSDTSKVALHSVGGDVTLVNDLSALASSATGMPFFASNEVLSSNTIAPPNLAAVALGGNVRVDDSMALWPAAHGNLDLLAADSVLLQSPGGSISILMSDADPTSLLTVNEERTVATNVGVAISTDLEPVTKLQISEAHAGIPTHGGGFAADGQPDSTPARIVALQGDVSVSSLNALQPNATSLISIPKPVDIIAGRDIVDLDLAVQQFASNNVSNIVAGRDFIFPTSRTPGGTIAPNSAGVTVDGPGQLLVSAGRDVNLGTSGGIVSEGNTSDPALGPVGANVSVSAGVSGLPANSPQPTQAQAQAFVTTYLANSDVYDQQLIDYVQSMTGRKSLTKPQALQVFEALTPSMQQALIETVFFDELRAGGRSAAAAGPTHDDFTRAFADLTTLFPGSNPNLKAGETDPYSGDLLLYFSQIYTTHGGDINLFAPGGQINVGLASAPTAFGITKTASQLGVVAEGEGSVNMVAYSNIEVNQSRVFAADGGNILMWSTEGDIDAGRGAKTAISAPPPVVTTDPKTGAVTVTFLPALTGSGIQALSTTAGTSPGDVDLFAPRGVVNANDAGIVAGNLTIAATAVLGSNNITVSGTSVGVPVTVTGLGASLSSASASGSAATSVGESAAGASQSQASKSPIASSALAWLDVFVLGLGEEQCRTDDLECIKRQKH